MVNPLFHTKKRNSIWIAKNFYMEETKMTMEKLKELLDSGAITQAEYDALVKTVEDQEPPTDEPPVDEPKTDAIDYDKIERIVQGRVDKAMAQERKEKAELKRKIERMEKAKMSDDELKEYEIGEREKTIAERERALTEKENRIFAIKAIKEAGLDDGSDISLSLVDFVMGEDETEITSNVKAFKELFDRAVAAEVDKRFKAGGRLPNAGASLNGGKNPWMKDQWNLTQQMEIESRDPDTAAKLMAAAGIR